MAQQLYGAESTAQIAEAVQARVKDPLWFLARQWQVGEFAAENGGRPAGVSVGWEEFALEGVDRSPDGTGPQEPLDLDAPLEWAVEREDPDGDSPAWRAEALEHGFELTTAAHRLRGEEYVGPSLDWHGVDLVAAAPAAPSDTGVRQVVPTQLVVPGAPHPRWWRLEDPDTYLDSPHDPEPSVLSVLVPELNYVDVNDWFVFPLAQRAGTLRRITALTVVDSFGIATDLRLLGADGWQVFTLTPSGVDVDVDGARELLFVPHTAISVLTNDPVEDVRFHRDEHANLVWAVEHAYRDEAGELVQGGDPAAPEPPVSAADVPPRYRFVSGAPPRAWIPYIPRAEAGPGGEVTGLYLRRGRTDPDATLQRPQHRSRVVAESWRLGEHEVPPEGVRVRRAHRYARGSDGGAYFWVGRRVEPAPTPTLPHTTFDVLEPGPT